MTRDKYNNDNKGGSYRKAPSNSLNTNEISWVCPNSKCLNVNSSKNKRCGSCGTSSNFKQTNVALVASIGKGFAEKSGGLFSEEDWECPKCKNINWAKRFYCNLCKAPRFRSTENRTGYGGGYKENEGVEYNRRTDINQEIDEFGRRRGKIKIMENINQSVNDVVEGGESEYDSESESNDALDKKSSTCNSSSDHETNTTNKNSQTESEQSEDEDDDDDGDDDLSKYNLDFSDDESNSKNKSDNESEDEKNNSFSKRAKPTEVDVEIKKSKPTE